MFHLVQYTKNIIILTYNQCKIVNELFYILLLILCTAVHFALIVYPDSKWHILVLNSCTSLVAIELNGNLCLKGFSKSFNVSQFLHLTNGDGNGTWS